MTRPETPMQLWLYVATFFNFVMPWKSMCQAHDTPFDMLWALWTGRPPSFIAIGARDSYKTLTLAASETLDIIHNGCGVVHIGAIESQALKCYSYVKKNLQNFDFLLQRPPLMSRTDLTTGGHLEVLPCTINRVNSPHEPKVRFDEVELADPLAYQEAKFIAASDEKGNEASMCYTTTRKFAYGLAQQEIELALAAGRKIFMWCYKDISERCPDERSGTEDVEIWVNPLKLTWTRKKVNREQRPYVVKNKCLDCKIVASCRGDLKRASGIKKIGDLITRFENASPEHWLAQMECLRPSRQGLMIYNFDPDVNAVKINWDMFLDNDSKFNRERYIHVWGKDWGWRPDATVVLIIDTRQDIAYVIKEFNYAMKTTEQIAREMLEWCRSTPFGFPDDIQCDRSEPGLIATMQSAGFPMARAVEETDIEGGCDLINYLCKPPGNQKPMFYVDVKLCPTLIWEMSSGYVRAINRQTNEPGDKPKDANNHFVDALRYAIWKYLRRYVKAAGYYDSGAAETARGHQEAESLTESLQQGTLGEEDMAALSHLLLNPDG